MSYYCWSATFMFPPPDCIPLSDIDGGNVVVTGYAIGGIATYSCGTGLSRNGDNTRTCTTGVGWSGTKPTCGNAATNSTVYIANVLLFNLIRNYSVMLLKQCSV